MIRAILRNAGIHPKRLIASAGGWLRYARERDAFRGMVASTGMPWGPELPILTEWHESSGTLGAYFYQDRLVASWILDAKPSRHVDVGSRIDGFVGHLSLFRQVEVIDIRPQPLCVPNVVFHQLDLMRELPDPWQACTDSLSCLHTIEHFGLGRYGDAIDPDGHLKGISQLKRMVAPEGVLYLSTPVGHERIEFNAHRVFAPETVLSWFAEGWELLKCAVMDDDLQLNEEAGVKGLMEFGGRTGLVILCARKVARF